MGGRGVLFAVDADDAAALLAAAGHDDVVEIVDRIEERWDRAFLSETDKAWYAIHLCLAADDDGTELPEGRCILGSVTLSTEDDCTIAFTPAEEVAATAEALAVLDAEGMRARYDRIDPETYAWADLSDDDFRYTWVYFEDIRKLWSTAAASGRSVVFSVDH